MKKSRILKYNSYPLLPTKIYNKIQSLSLKSDVKLRLIYGLFFSYTFNKDFIDPIEYGVVADTTEYIYFPMSSSLLKRFFGISLYNKKPHLVQNLLLDLNIELFIKGYKGKHASIYKMPKNNIIDIRMTSIEKYLKYKNNYENLYKNSLPYGRFRKGKYNNFYIDFQEIKIYFKNLSNSNNQSKNIKKDENIKKPKIKYKFNPAEYNVLADNNLLPNDNDIFWINPVKSIEVSYIFEEPLKYYPRAKEAYNQLKKYIYNDRLYYIDNYTATGRNYHYVARIPKVLRSQLFRYYVSIDASNMALSLLISSKVIKLETGKDKPQFLTLEKYIKNRNYFINKVIKEANKILNSDKSFIKFNNYTFDINDLKRSKKEALVYIKHNQLIKQSFLSFIFGKNPYFLTGSKYQKFVMIIISTLFPEFYKEINDLAKLYEKNKRELSSVFMKYESIIMEELIDTTKEENIETVRIHDEILVEEVTLNLKRKIIEIENMYDIKFKFDEEFSLFGILKSIFLKDNLYFNNANELIEYILEKEHKSYLKSIYKKFHNKELFLEKLFDKTINLYLLKELFDKEIINNLIEYNTELEDITECNMNVERGMYNTTTLFLNLLVFESQQLLFLKLNRLLIEFIAQRSKKF